MFDVVSGGGKLVWDRRIDDSFGRGCLTDDAIYVPVKDSIVKLDPASGKELLQVGVALTTNDPVGNLYSDGEKLWATGAGRVYAMTNLEHRLTMLAEQIAAGNGEAQLNRMRLYAKSGQRDLMLADLRGAYELFKSSLAADEAAQKFLGAIAELKLPQQEPALALELLAEQFAASPSPPAQDKAALRQADLLAAALATIRQRKLAGNGARILAVAPLLNKEYLQTSAAQTLQTACTSAADVAALKAAVESGSAVAQMIAAVPLSRLAPQEARKLLEPLVRSEHDGVKLAAARGLANLGDRAALPVLLSLLDSAEPRIRARSHQSLRAISSQPITFIADGTKEERNASIAKWKEWLEKEGEKVAWKTPLPEGNVPLGRTLIVSQVQQSVMELDESHKKTWEARLQFPWGCQGLPNGHRLVAVLGRNEVVEFDERGVQVWSKGGLPGPPYSVQRLENGHTLVACPDASQVLEIDPGGKVVTTFPFSANERPVQARRLDNGRTLVCLQGTGKVVEIEKPGASPVWAVEGLNGPASATRLENGNTLIVQMFSREVIEVGPSGKRSNMEWQSKIPLVNPTDAVRLPNGNTLISDQRGVFEVDPSGSEIRRQFNTPNVSSISHF
jgi:hypothetical protein